MTLLPILAAIIAGSAPGVAGDGYLSAPDLTGFVVGYKAGNSEQAITEQVPQGETVEHWTRMVTTQRMTGLVERATATSFVAIVSQNVTRSCAGATMRWTQIFTIDGRPAARLRADCPLNPDTGLPETFWMVAVQGPHDMHVKQVAYRAKPNAAQVSWAEEFLNNLHWCEAGERNETCSL